MTKQKRHHNNRGKQRRPDNRNQNRQHNNNNKPRGHKPRGGHQSENNFLPPSALIQEYEYIKEGSLDRIISMAEAEQDQRQDWEAAYFKAQVTSERIGQIFAFILTLIVLALTWLLADQGKDIVAASVAGGFFFAMGCAGYASGKSRKKMRRRK